jgi:hypothetical protein
MPSQPSSTGSLWGVDFTSAPSARKAITVAQGHVTAASQVRRAPLTSVTLTALQRLPTMAAFEALLRTPGPWFGAFDFPFGLPRAFVDEMALGSTCDTVVAEVHRRYRTRREWQTAIDAWTNPRPAGAKLIHRRTDRSLQGVSSTSPLQTRYVPVAYMYYEGLSRLVQANVSLPGLRRGRRDATGIEGYPALLAHALIGRASYKNTDDAQRRHAREAIVQGLQAGASPLAVRIEMTPGQAQVLQDDASGDLLDAVLCMTQAAWAKGQPRQGRPAQVDAVEGWIASA